MRCGVAWIVNGTAYLHVGGESFGTRPENFDIILCHGRNYKNKSGMFDCYAANVQKRVILTLSEATLKRFVRTNYGLQRN